MSFTSISARNILLFTSVLLFLCACVLGFTGMERTIVVFFVNASLAMVFFSIWNNIRHAQKQLHIEIDSQLSAPNSKEKESAEHTAEKRDMFGLIRVFASPEDAKNHGWSFQEEIGTFQGAPLYRLALLDGQTWEWDGLSGNVFSPLISDHIRMFGQLRYKKIEEACPSLVLSQA